MHHVAHFTGERVGGNTDAAVGAHAHHGERERIVARKYGEVRPQKRAQLADAVGSARRFLEANDALRQIFPQTRDSVYRDAHSGASRTIVADYRPAALFGDSAGMLIETF